MEQTANAIEPTTPTAPEVAAPEASAQAADSPQVTQAQAKALGAEYDDYEVETIIDGEPVKMTVKELRNVKQKEVASNKRFQQAAEIEKKVKAFLDRGKEVPEELLSKLGIDPEEFAEALLRRRIEEAQMSPEQRQAMEEKRRFEEEKKQWEATVAQRVQHEIDQGITEAFRSTGLPKSPFLVARIAAMVNESIKLSQKNPDQKPLSFQEAAVKVKEWFVEGTRQTLKSLPLEERLKVLGDDVVEELMQYRLTRLGQAKKPASEEPATAQAPAKKQPKKVITSKKEWEEWINSL